MSEFPETWEAAQLRNLCRDHSMRSTVRRVTNGYPDWLMAEGRLRNTRADYFSIGVCEPEPGRPVLMMDQREPVLVMLLVADIDRSESVLLSLRTEPGLIRFTNLTTTIQSTATNYLRRHGGMPTPFIDVAADPHSFGTVLYDAEHYDWGGYYVYKTKRFLIVKLAVPVTAPPGYCWVKTAVAGSLLQEDHLITNDLRVALPYLFQPTPDDARSHVVQAVPDRDSLFTGSDFAMDFVDSRGTHLTFVETVTETREVRSWVQPLLVPNGPVKIRLPVAKSKSNRLFAVEERTQPGLLGRRLWYPADTEGGQVVRRATTSAEGGRFWQHRIDLELLEIESACHWPAGDVVWLSADDLANLVAQPLQTSLELRMAWSIACCEQSW
jgi:hypothetical protein